MTTNSKHTPGPWHTGYRCDIYSQLGDLVAVADTFQTNEEEAKANAQLIARAPELLSQNAAMRAALEQLLKAEPMQQGERSGYIMAVISHAIDMARAALKWAA